MKVLITRELEEGKILAEKVKKIGLEPVLFPVIKTVPIPFNFFDVSRYDVFIFPSKNAVKYFLENVPGDLLKGKMVIAVGEKTKKALEKKGIKDIKIPRVYSSEGVLEFIKGNISFFSDKRILIPRAKKGIDTLPEALKDQVKEITVLPVYETVLNIPQNKEKIKELFEKNEIKFCIFTSPSTVENFLKIFPEKGIRYLNATCIAVIGTTTKRAVEKKGLKVCIVPEKFTVDGILQKIKEQLL